jgi:magnesium-transporting ATPase (P-type)
MFYKNVFVVIPVWMYGFVSFFSGNNIYTSALLSVYNLIFTAFPVIWFATFDWEHDKKTFLNNP